jgi:hypothetical protein
VGDAALLFDPSSTDEITSCLERLWVDDELCKDLVEKGKRHAANWGPAQFRDKLVKIVEALTT